MLRLFVSSLLVIGAHALSVLPKPASQTSSGETYVVDRNSFDFNATAANNDILRDAMSRYYSIIFGARSSWTGNTASPQRYGFGSAIDATEEAARTAAAAGTITGCDVTVTGPDGDSAVKTLKTDESYTLVVKAPRISIAAKSVFGAMYAMESLSQLVESGFTVNGTTVTDKPRYAFRAIMIDTSRHFYPLTAIKQNLDAMAYSKFNVLHWHIVDSVSFPFQSQAFPSMAVDGAYSPDHIYTHDNVREITSYAMNRGIRVIPEFDTPGHVNRGWENLGVLTRCYDSDGKPADTGPLNPTLNRTYDVINKLYAEILDVFAPEKFVHVGGDEVPSACWASNPQIQAYMKEHPEIDGFAGLETLYEEKLLSMLKEHDASYIVWQEIFDNGAKVLPDTIIDVWKGGNWQEEMTNVTAAGFHTVLSAPFYLNYISYGPDWPKYYNVEPSNFTGGEKAEQDGLVGGIEACFWSEYIDSTNFMPRAWPRVTAVAERAWSTKDTRDLVDAEARIHEFRCKAIDRGIPAEPIGTCGNEGCTSPLSPVRVPGYAGFCPTEWQPAYNPPF